MLCLPNAPVSKQHNLNPFIIKNWHLADMLTKLGHQVYLYGVEGGDAPCYKYVNCLDEAQYQELFPYDVNQYGYDYDNIRAWDIYNQNCKTQLSKFLEEGDVILLTMGAIHDPVKIHFPNYTYVEFGIGHEASCPKNYRIFESYAWRNFCYGRELNFTPRKLDAVIPNYYDEADYIFNDKPDDYFFFIGRLTQHKGLQIAIDATASAGKQLLVAGTGQFKPEYSHVTYVGPVNIQQRAELMSNAKATFVPSQYVEPFGSVAVESLLCGTPIITSDFGALPEINQNLLTGHICKDASDYLFATKFIDVIDRHECYRAAIPYLKQHVSLQYDSYFLQLQQHLSEGIS